MIKRIKRKERMMVQVRPQDYCRGNIAPQSFMRCCSGWKQTCSRSLPLGTAALELARKIAQRTATDVVKSGSSQLMMLPVGWLEQIRFAQRVNEICVKADVKCCSNQLTEINLPRNNN